MISLSREWAILSNELYKQDFIDELAGFLNQYNIRTLLECGCGDGHILKGLAEKGFQGIGVDSNLEMIELALNNNPNPNISYELMSWLDINHINKNFDAVICRGNSLSAVASWGDNHINPESKNMIKKSIDLFFKKLKQRGLLYLDCCSQDEINRNGGDVEIKTSHVQLSGKIEYDWKNMERRVFGRGIVLGEEFQGGSASYLLTPNELENLVRDHNPSYVWHPKLVYEKNYEIICALT